METNFIRNVNKVVWALQFKKELLEHLSHKAFVVTEQTLGLTILAHLCVNHCQGVISPYSMNKDELSGRRQSPRERDTANNENNADKDQSPSPRSVGESIVVGLPDYEPAPVYFSMVGQFGGPCFDGLTNFWKKSMQVEVDGSVEVDGNGAQVRHLAVNTEQVHAAVAYIGQRAKQVTGRLFITVLRNPSHQDGQLEEVGEVTMSGFWLEDTKFVTCAHFLNTVKNANADETEAFLKVAKPQSPRAFVSNKKIALPGISASTYYPGQDDFVENSDVSPARKQFAREAGIWSTWELFCVESQLLNPVSAGRPPSFTSTFTAHNRSIAFGQIETPYTSNPCHGRSGNSLFAQTRECSIVGTYGCSGGMVSLLFHGAGGWRSVVVGLYHGESWNDRRYNEIIAFTPAFVDAMRAGTFLEH
ncbi:hypothetical protein AYO20_11360 [Fonsecaea nubica]|uniref:Uncharacterized protein n=1 Tax=Fonsecaea nubica TaxID=856822 RepID=A0A178BXM0_9EURO|nr:hypothetical protein AYO20_11360 [Fonsecaea nubica]OAL21423.1 hypothetical protein AYO20_11360 [Fonsecaea nubica]